MGRFATVWLMRPALSRPPRALRISLSGRGHARAEGQSAAPRGPRWASSFTRDPYLTDSASLVPIAALVLLLQRGPAALVPLSVLSICFVGAQVVLGQIPARRRPMTALGWSFLRLILALMFLVILGALQAFAGSGTGIFNTAMGALNAAMGGGGGGS